MSSGAFGYAMHSVARRPISAGPAHGQSCRKGHELLSD